MATNPIGGYDPSALGASASQLQQAALQQALRQQASHTLTPNFTGNLSSSGTGSWTTGTTTTSTGTGSYTGPVHTNLDDYAFRGDEVKKKKYANNIDRAIDEEVNRIRNL
ncbi:MAG: hypothetical protein ACXABY_30730 [Candidatus Thorarchaeota archaeon]